MSAGGARVHLVSGVSCAACLVGSAGCSVWIYVMEGSRTDGFSGRLRRHLLEPGLPQRTGVIHLARRRPDLRGVASRPHPAGFVPVRLGSIARVGEIFFPQYRRHADRGSPFAGAHGSRHDGVLGCLQRSSGCGDGHPASSSRSSGAVCSGRKEPACLDTGRVRRNGRRTC